MPYCRECDESTEGGGDRCPTCGSTLRAEGSATDGADFWGLDDSTDGATDAADARGGEHDDAADFWAAATDDSVDAQGRETTDSGDSWRTWSDNSDDSWNGDPDGESDSTAGWPSDETSGSIEEPANATGEPTDAVEGWTDAAGKPTDAAGEPIGDRRGGENGRATRSATTAAAYRESNAATRGDPERPASEPRVHRTDLITFAFKFPLGKGGKPLLIDTLLVFLGFLLVPLVFSYGYSVRIGRAAARGDAEPPSFDDWGGLAKDGLILLVVALGWSVGFAVVGAVLAAGGAAIGDSLLFVPYLGLSAVVLLGGAYVAGASLPVLLGTGSLGETFGEFRFLDFALSRHYLKGVVLLAICWVLAGIAMWIVTLVLTITIVGIVLLIPLAFVAGTYLTNLLFAAWGYVYNEAAEAGDVPPVRPDDPLGIE